MNTSSIMQKKKQGGAGDQARQQDGLKCIIHVDTSEVDEAIKKLKELRGLYYSVQALQKKWKGGKA